MTNQKSTKRALVLSFLALFVCVTMLIGTTFAWFTDSVTSGRNKIQSGNLDVELYYALTADDVAADNWTKVTASSDIYGYNLWEPGFTKVAYFKVVNNGSLALKYQLTADVYNETAGKNVAGESFLLSDYIYTAVVDTTATRDSILAMNGANLKNSIAMSSAALLESGKSTVVGLALWMPTTVGNEANHDGENKPSIEFGINLVATQAMYENDSFGNDYDKLATADTEEELLESLAGDFNIIMLGADIELTDISSFAVNAPTAAITIPADKTVTIDLAGHTLSMKKVQTSAYALIENKGNLTIKDIVGSGKISYEDITPYTADPGWASNTIRNEGTLNIVGGTVENISSDAVMSMGYPHAIDAYQGSVTNVSGGTVKSLNYDSIRMFCNSETLATTVNITGGTIINRISFQDPAASRAGYGVLNISGGNFITTGRVNANVRLLNFSNVASNMKATVTGGTFDAGFKTQDVVGAGVELTDWLDSTVSVPVTGAADLSNALANGGDVSLGSDIKDAPVATTAPYGNKYGIAIDGGVLNGNGKVLDFNSPGGDNYGIMISDGTIKNVSVGGAFRGIVIMDPKDNVYIDNVIINDEDVCYALNTAEGNGTASVYVSNSTLCGWTSIGNVVKAVYFTNCSFGQGTYYTNVYGRLVKPYCDAVFENCDFSSKFYVDLSAFTGTKVVFKNCSVNGVKITADNWASMVAPEDTCADGQISVELKNGTYLSASNVADYFVIE